VTAILQKLFSGEKNQNEAEKNQFLDSDQRQKFQTF
jgi:hypothetical protein